MMQIKIHETHFQHYQCQKWSGSLDLGLWSYDRMHGASIMEE